MGFVTLLKKDWRGNRGNSKGFIFILLFRASHFFASGNILLRIIGLPVRIFYKFFVRWILGIDIPDITKIGGGFCVWHGQGLIIHGDCVIGEFVSVRHNTTIGQKRDDGGVPVIGNNVNISTQCVVIGEITIGDNCQIGACSLINKSVPPNSLAYGNPFIVKPLKTANPSLT